MRQTHARSRVHPRATHPPRARRCQEVLALQRGCTPGFAEISGVARPRLDESGPSGCSDEVNVVEKSRPALSRAQLRVGGGEGVVLAKRIQRGSQSIPLFAAFALTDGASLACSVPPKASGLAARTKCARRGRVQERRCAACTGTRHASSYRRWRSSDTMVAAESKSTAARSLPESASVPARVCSASMVLTGRFIIRFSEHPRKTARHETPESVAGGDAAHCGEPQPLKRNRRNRNIVTTSRSSQPHWVLQRLPGREGKHHVHAVAAAQVKS